MNDLPLALHPPNPLIFLRPVSMDDVDDLLRHCWPDRTRPEVTRLVARAERIAAQGYGLGVVALEAEGVIGYGQCTNWPRCAEISDLAVWEPKRCQGIGTAIIQYLTQLAHQWGAREVELGVALDNQRALALYRRLGFRDQRQAHVDLNGVRTAVLYLRLALAGSASGAVGRNAERW
ncbi:MAG: GNAT family N-acetyltransferase [Chloroflexota bacterium]|nr:MAG: hypothetical protein DIU68_16810 [Chloroflexota bacterium]